LLLLRCEVLALAFGFVLSRNGCRQVVFFIAMKQYNKIELCGIIGSVHTVDYESGTIARISVGVNNSFLSASENEYTKTEWFDVHISSRDTSVDLKKLTRGDCVYAEGTMASSEYVGSDGISHYYWRVNANIFKKI
jgi:single-stranded DNA-binding protein